MFRHTCACCFAVLAFLANTPAWADNPPPALKETLALQEAMQNAIQEAEPAIACILVSRSDLYRKLNETPPVNDDTGKLGSFDPNRVKARNQDFTNDQVKEMRKLLDLKDASSIPEAFGSGVVIDESGLILTNEHVVRDATKIYVRLPGNKGSYADIHAADPRSDLAVLRLTEPVGKLKAIKMGDGGKVRKGQLVLSLANPFAAGFRDGSPSASWGIISNIRRRAPGNPLDADAPKSEVERRKSLHEYGTLLQTDARLNLGCSGGALIDLKGELIGLTTSLAAISGNETAGGFAVPMDAAWRKIVEVLKRGEEVEYGFLGVSISEERKLGEAGGIKITGVAHASPAALSGLAGGDIIVSINGTPINDYDDLFLNVGILLLGSEAKIEVIRAGSVVPRMITVTLTKFYVPGRIIASRRPAAQRGLRVDHFSILMQALPPQAQPRHLAGGVVIREVLPGSSAADALLKVNDVITHVKGQAVSTPSEFYRLMQSANGPVEVTLDSSRSVKLN